MYREINPPEEIIKRLSFVFYIAMLICAFVLGLIGFAQGKAAYLLLSTVLFIISYPLRKIGKTHLEFARLSRSFPYGSPEDELSADLRQEVEQLISDFEKQGKDWVRRNEIRIHLACLVAKEPLLLKVYKKEILSILPLSAGE